MPPCSVRAIADDARWTTALVCFLSGCLAVATAPPPAEAQEVRVRTLTYAEAPARAADGGTVELELDLYRPPDTESASRPAVVLMHGGGFVGGRRDLQENRQVGRELAARGYVVASIDYRLWRDRPVISDWAGRLADRVSGLGLPPFEAMESRHGPAWTTAVGAAAEDALRVLEWMRTRGPDFGVDPDRIVLGGMSAGALISVEVAYRLERLGVDVPDLAAIISVRGAWLFASDDVRAPVAPGGPPLFIVHGTEDRRVPFDEAVRTYQAAREAGVAVELHPIVGSGHELGGAPMLDTRLDDRSLLVDRLDRFLSAAIDDPGSLPPAVCVGAGNACPDTTANGASPDHVSDEIVAAAASLLSSVDEEPGVVEGLFGYDRADELRLEFDHPARHDWSYWPRPREGLSLERMTADQRVLVHDLLAAHLSGLGYLKVAHVMRLEDVLVDRETVGFPRGAEGYTAAIFGDPGGGDPWGWRFEGHHVSLNVTLASGEVSVTPSFLGASPAALARGPHAGLRPLRYERELARKLFLSLDPDQADRALLADTVPGDILSSQFQKERADWDAWRSLVLRPAGTPASEFDARQRALVERLLDQIVGVYRPEIAAAYREDLQLDRLRFAWMGSRARGAPQYFRLQGPDFVFEFDASQEDGNHVHTVWRDPGNDFGDDLLRRHYAEHEHRTH